MKARGKKIVHFRISSTLLAELDCEIFENNATRPRKPMTRTTLILKSIREKIAHLKRSRSGSKSKRATAVQVAAEQEAIGAELVDLSDCFDSADTPQHLSEGKFS